MLLFLWLRSLTGAFWRSAFVAALFALHPLHVESVAWVAERKDVLCAFFGLLSFGPTHDTRRWRRRSGRDRNPKSEARNPKPETCRSAASGQADWSAPRRPSPSLAIFYFYLSLLLLRSRLDEQAHAGDLALCHVAAGLLAAGPTSEGRMQTQYCGLQNLQPDRSRSHSCFRLLLRSSLSSRCPPRRASSRSWPKRRAARWSRWRPCRLGRECSTPWTPTFATARQAVLARPTWR